LCPEQGLEEPSIHYFNNFYFLKIHPNLTGVACGIHQRVKEVIATSIICSFAQRQFNVNNKCLLATARRFIALSKFEVVPSKIPRYLKVYTHSNASPSNTNS